MRCCRGSPVSTIDTVTEGNPLKELANRHYALTKVRPDSRKPSAAVKMLRAGAREGGAFSASEELGSRLHLARHVLAEQSGGGEHIRSSRKCGGVTAAAFGRGRTTPSSASAYRTPSRRWWTPATRRCSWLRA